MCKSIHVEYHANKLKHINHRIISIDAEKAFDKVQLCQDKNSGDLRTYLIIIKGICKKIYSQYYIKWKQDESTSSKAKNETRKPTLLFDKVLKVLIISMRQVKDIKERK